MKKRFEKTVAKSLRLTREEWAELEYAATIHGCSLKEEIGCRIAEARVIPFTEDESEPKTAADIIGNLTLEDGEAIEKATGGRITMRDLVDCAKEGLSDGATLAPHDADKRGVDVSAWDIASWLKAKHGKNASERHPGDGSADCDAFTADDLCGSWIGLED